MSLTPLNTSFRNKIIATVVLAVLSATAVISVGNYFKMVDAARSAALEELSVSTRLNADRFSDLFDVMQTDTEIIAGAPVVQNLVQAQSLQAGSAIEGIGDAEDRMQLASLFRSLISARPHYSRIRYVSLEGEGYEVVRVAREGAKIIAVSDRDLKPLGNADFVEIARVLGAGPADFAPVSYYQLDGLIVEPRTPSLRAIKPVFDPQGRQLGAIIINANYETFLKSIPLDLKPGRSLYVIDNAGSFLKSENEGTQSEFSFAEDPEHRPAGVLPAFLDVNALSGGSVGAENSTYAVRFRFGRASSDKQITVVTQLPTSLLMHGPNQKLKYNLILMLVLAMASAAGAAIAAVVMARPLTELTRKISEYRFNGEPIKVNTAGHDEISALARAFSNLSNELISTSERAQAVYNNAADGIMTLDANGVVEDMNPVARSIFGIMQMAPLSYRIERFLPEVNSGTLSEARASGRNVLSLFSREMSGRTLAGEAVPLEIATSMTGTGDSETIILLLKDISERKDAERRQKKMISDLEAYRDELERSNAELDSFAYVASHDLKAPLRVIDNASKWLEEDLEEYLTEDTRESMMMLRGRVGRMERLLDDLLAYSRIGRVEEKTQAAPLAEIIENVRLLSGLPENFELRVSGPFDKIQVSILPLQTILLNLVSNAVKHHDREQGEIRISADIEAGSLLLAVEDDGPGIPQEYHDRIFDLFQTLRPRDQVEASGMGLAFVKKYVGLAGGEISVTSGASRGTTFHLRWPLASRDLEERSAA